MILPEQNIRLIAGREGIYERNYIVDEAATKPLPDTPNGESYIFNMPPSAGNPICALISQM